MTSAVWLRSQLTLAKVKYGSTIYADEIGYHATGPPSTLGSGNGPTGTLVTYDYYSTTSRLKKATSALGAPEVGPECVDNVGICYDNVGNMTSDGTFTYSYNNRNLMSSATLSSATTNYAYNAHGQRIVKATPSVTTYYVHGGGGQLLSEYQATAGDPELVREYIYLGGRLLASLAGPANALPEVEITSPDANDGFAAPGTVAITATASDADGSIANVKFYNGSTLRLSGLG